MGIEGRHLFRRAITQATGLFRFGGGLSFHKARRRAEKQRIQAEGAFDPDFYRKQFPPGAEPPQDLLGHYLDRGWRDGFDPCAWFDTACYLKENPDVTRNGCNPFGHYLRYGRAEGRRVAPSHRSADTLCGLSFERAAVLIAAELDEAFYDAQLGEGAGVVSRAEHYLHEGWRMGLDPAPWFSTRGYLELHRDIARAGVVPLLHFLLAGRTEGRRTMPAAGTDRIGDGLSEWVGYASTRQMATESDDCGPPDPSLLAFTHSLAGLPLEDWLEQTDFPEPREPVDVSVVIPCLGQDRMTAECLNALRRAAPVDLSVEIVVVDNGSGGAFYAALARKAGLRCLRFETNTGFGPACNAGIEAARGRHVLLLNNDTQVAPGCIETLARVLDDDDTGEGDEPGRIAIVGPKLISFDGRLQEAGCVLETDGTGHLVGFGMDPSAPRFNYRREVEHLSAAAWLVRRNLFLEAGGFDAAFAPAYCEDADLVLRLRARGFRIVYEPQALVAHHLSATSADPDPAPAETGAATGAETGAAPARLALIARNRAELLRRWGDTICDRQIRTIAFYLPQYHPIPENDLWWGKGFTEWTNVTRARPVFRGHVQPKQPTDLGYYDLRAAEPMEQQAALARRYGITGFCHYYYWFAGHRLLERPIDRILETGRPAFPFCLCWANENWTRRWDGGDQAILMGQNYGDADSVAMARDLVRHFRSEHYIRIGGRPLFLVYRIKDLPFPRRTVEVWRNVCRAEGIGEICVAMVESFELSAAPEDPAAYGCDITVEFPAHGMVKDRAMPVELPDPKWQGEVHDYRKLAAAFMTRREPGFRRLRSVLVGWDNTPRHPGRSLVLAHATPGAFQAWLEWTFRRTIEQNSGEDRIVFINAWNEWCEGSYLEPDLQNGHAYLQAVRNALDLVSNGGRTFEL